MHAFVAQDQKQALLHIKNVCQVPKKHASGTKRWSDIEKKRQMGDYLTIYEDKFQIFIFFWGAKYFFFKFLSLILIIYHSMMEENWLIQCAF